MASTYCICPIDIASVLGLTVATPDGGPFTRDADGGFVAINRFSGRVDYALNASGGGGACRCNLPSGAHDSVTGTR